MKSQKEIAIENGLKVGAEVVLCEGTCYVRTATVCKITEDGFYYDEKPEELRTFDWWS